MFERETEPQADQDADGRAPSPLHTLRAAHMAYDMRGESNTNPQTPLGGQITKKSTKNTKTHENVFSCT